MILYNGQSGSLGQYFGAALAERGLPATALRARLEDRASLRQELRRLLEGVERVTLVPMAALVSVPACERDRVLAERTNVTDLVATVGDFLDAAGERGSVLYVSTGHVYAEHSRAIDEEGKLGPRSVYAETKLAAERALAELCGSDVPLAVARVFGLVAPRQPPHYVLPAMIQRVRERRLDGIPGLDYRRDYLDARDVSRILASLAARRHAGTFNVCSGEAVSIRQLIEEVLRTVEPVRWQELAATLVPAPARADDVPSIVGNPARLVAALGEAARQIALSQTVADAVREK